MRLQYGFETEGYKQALWDGRDKAESDLIMALRIYPKLLRPRLLQAEMYWNNDQPHQARAVLRDVISIEPKNTTDEISWIKAEARRLLDLYS